MCVVLHMHEFWKELCNDFKLTSTIYLFRHVNEMKVQLAESEHEKLNNET